MGNAAVNRLLVQAVEHFDAGRPDEAEALCADILTADPEHVSTLHLSAVIAFVTNRAAEGAVLLQRVFSLDPDHAPAFGTLGDALAVKGEQEGAVAAFERAVAAWPQDAGLQAKLGTALCELSRFEEAEAAYRKAIELDPSFVRARCNLAIALTGQQRLEQAEEIYRAIIARDPAYPDIWFNLGNVLSDQKRLDDAVAAYWRAIAADPCYVLAYTNLAVALREVGEIDEAISVSQRAVTLDPAHPHARYNHGHYLLLNGDLRNGFADYRWERKCKNSARYLPTFSEPEWQGEAFAGRTLLLFAEYGLGDALQFVRYVPMAAALGGSIVLEVQLALVPLLRTMSGVTVVPRGGPRPPFDLQLPLMDLPRVFGTTLDTVPAAVPYLHPDPAKFVRWCRALNDTALEDKAAFEDKALGVTPAGGTPSLKVGVVWAGNPRHKSDHDRSLSAEAVLPRLVMPGVQLYSLQKESRPADIPVLAGLAADIIDLGPRLDDFAETAAAVAALDLVIAVDTSVAHLAGALGRPVWLLTPYALDWRWLRDREDSPWYPTMRLFRQQKPQAWDGVLARVSAELARIAAGERDRIWPPSAGNRAA